MIALAACVALVLALPYVILPLWLVGFEGMLMSILPYRDIEQGGVLYLRRFYLTPTVRGRAIFLHHILRSDDDRDPHDHPWAFTSLMVVGSYFEHNYQALPDIGECLPSNIRFVRSGNLTRRKATDIHRLRLRRPCWTLVLKGKRERKWGFWTKGGWVYWREYLGIPERSRIPVKVSQ